MLELSGGYGMVDVGDEALGNVEYWALAEKDSDDVGVHES